MCDIGGEEWRVRRRDVKALGGVEVSARGMSGVSRMRRVLRVGVVVREEIAVSRVDLRCARSGEVRIECPVVWLGDGVVGGGADELGAVRAGCEVGGGGGGPLAGGKRPGGPLTGSVCPGLCDDSISFDSLAGCKPVCGCCGRGGGCDCDCGVCASPMTNPLNPSTNANLFSRFSLSRSNPPPFLASCLQNS